MATRNVFGTILRSDATPWSNYVVKFWRAPGSYTDDETYPSDTISVVTDENGEFTVDLWCSSEGFVSSNYICQLQNEDFMFPLVPGSPVDLPQLRGLAPGGVQIAEEVLIGYVTGNQFELVEPITYHGTYIGVLSTADILWRDGSAGEYTTTTFNAAFEAVDAFTMTHTASGKTVVQAAVTRNADGSVTIKPPLSVS